MNRRAIGSRGESTAENFLTEHNAKIITRNFRNRYGEIDLIGYDEEYLVFFEVKYRDTIKTGYPEEAVNVKKQKQICKVADYYRVVHKIPIDTSIRYDVIAIYKEDIKWYKNAFSHIYR